MQVPTAPGSVQALQVPVQALLQQTPLTQNPDRQALPVAQGWPRFSLPQLPAAQVAGAVQSVLAVQLMLHVPVLPQPQGSHSVEVTVLQLPAPSQVRGGVSTSPVQVPATQTVLVPYSWHLPVPSHLPLVLQLAAPLSAQVVVGSAPPAATALQVPLPEAAQDMQVPVQVVAQQTPCWQRFVAHSDPAEQAVPLGFSEQLPPLHTVGETQSASAVQVVLQLFLVVASHSRLPGQLPGVTVLHVPAPSQVAAGVRTEPVQLAAAHCVPLGQSRQCPAPSHSPSVKQPEAAVIVHWLKVAGA